MAVCPKDGGPSLQMGISNAGVRFHYKNSVAKGNQNSNADALSHRVLSIEDGVLCYKYSPGPSRDVITVPVYPGSMQQEILHQCHNDPLLAIKELKKH